MGIKKAIKVIDLLANTTKEYPSIKDASEQLNVGSTLLNKYAKGKYKHPVKLRYKCSYIEKNS